MAYWDYSKVTEVAVSVDFDTAGATVIYTPGQPVDVFSLVMVCTEVSAGSSIVTVTKRNVDDTSSVTLGTFTVPASIALNATRRVMLAKSKTAATTGADGSTVYDAGTGVIELNPGEELVLTSDGVGTAGIFNVYVEHMPQGVNKRGTFTYTELAFTQA